MTAAVLGALVPALAVQATHTNVHNENIGGTTWDVCGAGGWGGLGGDQNPGTSGGQNKFPATFLTANPASKAGLGVTETAFRNGFLLNEANPMLYSWDYLQGFDGLVFQIVEKQASHPLWEARSGSVPNNAPMSYSVAVSGRLLGTTGVDVVLSFYRVIYTDADGDGVQDPDEKIIAVTQLAGTRNTVQADGAGAATFKHTLTGSFPATATHFVVSLASGAPRTNTTMNVVGTGGLATTAKTTVKVLDSAGVLTCQDPVHARCLLATSTSPIGAEVGPLQNRDTGKTWTNEQKKRAPVLSPLLQTASCLSVSRLL